MSTTDPTTERYATVMDSLIGDCTRLEDRVADLETQLRATAQAHNAAIAAQTSDVCPVAPGPIEKPTEQEIQERNATINRTLLAEITTLLCDECDGANV